MFVVPQIVAVRRSFGTILAGMGRPKGARRERGRVEEVEEERVEVPATQPPQGLQVLNTPQVGGKDYNTNLRRN